MIKDLMVNETRTLSDGTKVKAETALNGCEGCHGCGEFIKQDFEMEELGSCDPLVRFDKHDIIYTVVS